MILLVEDDEYLIGIYATKFELEGFKVLKASDGKRGFKLAVKETPDIILVDILMPGMNGFDLIKKLKNEEKTKNIPVVILSNLGQEKDVRRGIKLGVADYLIKVHLTPTEICERVKEIIK